MPRSKFKDILDEEFRSNRVRENKSKITLSLCLTDNHNITYIFRPMFPSHYSCPRANSGQCLKKHRTKLLVDNHFKTIDAAYPKNSTVIMEEAPNKISFYWLEGTIYNKYKYHLDDGLRCVFDKKKICSETARVVGMEYISKITENPHAFIKTA